MDIRFSTALQMMLTLAYAAQAGTPRVSSTQLAYGLGSNASLVRKLVMPLKRDGLITSLAGIGGGVMLARISENILLSEIYRSAVGEKRLLVGRPDVPHLCIVSSNVEQFFATIASEVEDAVLAALARRSLAEALNELTRATAKTSAAY